MQGKDANNKKHFGTIIGHIMAIVAVSMWGYSFVSTKELLNAGLGPVQIYISRFVIAYFIALCVAHKRLFAYNLREEGMFALCGICAGSIYFIAENMALEYTLTTNVSLLTSMSPLLTAMLVGLVYKTEKLGLGTWIGSAIAIVGVGCIVFNSSTSMEVRPIGDMLSLGAALSWAVYSLVLRQLNARYDIWFITRKTFFYGVVTAIPILLFEKDSVNIFAVIQEPVVFGNLLFLSLGASTAAYVIWAFTVKKVGAVKANNYMYLQSIFTLIVSAIVLHEHVNFIGYVGIVLILGGLWIGENINKMKPRLRTH